jgi:hypothetical protein
MYTSNKFHFNETLCVVISMATTDLNGNRSRPIFCFCFGILFPTGTQGLFSHSGRTDTVWFGRHVKESAYTSR